MPRRLPALVFVIALYTAVLALAPRPLAVAQDSTGATTRVSVSSDGAQGNETSEGPTLSADGRYVAFDSLASNLVAGDTNGGFDVFVHDRQTGTTDRVSVSSSGAQGNGYSWVPEISADGRYVAFGSLAANLVAGDTNGAEDIFVYDRQTGLTSRVSIRSDGVQGNDGSWSPVLSADGRFVVFHSYASNLVAGDTNSVADVFVHDRQTGLTNRVSVRSDGAQANLGSYHAAVSADGRYVAFDSMASNLLAEDTNESWSDVFIHDRQTGVTSLVSVRPNGITGIGSSYAPSLSDDGRYVAFDSDASDLVAGDTNGRSDAFVHDRQTGLTTLISVASDGTQGNNNSARPVLSPDGRYVAFTSEAYNLVAGDTNDHPDIFVRDLQTGATSRVSVSSEGTQTNGVSGDPVLSADGRTVAFHSIASNLVAGDTNGQFDVFVHDRQEPVLTPSITGFAPLSGPVGAAVTITGANFAGATALAFNGTSQPVFTVNADGTQIATAVSAGATTGRIAVTTPGGTAESATDFIVIPPPSITGFSPTAGPIGTSVTINGTNFTGATAVTFNGTNQPAFSVDAAGTQITAAVPAGATTGPIAVTTPGGVAAGATDFSVTVPPPPAIYLSATGNGTIGGKAFTSADILSYVQATNTWDILYDGSAINTPKNLGAFAFVGNEMLLGFSVAQVVPGLGTAKVPAQDLLRFTPTSTGYNNTAGTFALYFDGSDVGLTTSAEAIDALWIDAQGRLYISTTGTAKVNGPTGALITAHDEDVLRFTPTSTGANTAGAWALYWDPTSVTGMSAEDINGYWEDPATGARYVTILGGFNIGNTAYGGKFAGNGKTILRFAPNAAAPGGWAPAEKVTWLAAGATFPSNIDGIEMAR